MARVKGTLPEKTGRAPRTYSLLHISSREWLYDPKLETRERVVLKVLVSHLVYDENPNPPPDLLVSNKCTRSAVRRQEIYVNQSCSIFSPSQLLDPEKQLLVDLTRRMAKKDESLIPSGREGNPKNDAHPLPPNRSRRLPRGENADIGNRSFPTAPRSRKE